MAAHLDALVLDALDGVDDAVLVHGLVLVHIGAEAARADNEKDQLVDGGALLVLVAGGALVVVDPVLDEGLQRRVWSDDRICCQLEPSFQAH